jgi:hypothetical protein
MILDAFYERLLTEDVPFATCAALIRSSVATRFRFPVMISNGEDIAYFTKIFFSSKASYIPRCTAVTVSHPDSLRHNVEEVKRNGMALLDVIFNDPYYGGNLDYLIDDFAAFRSLSLFRRLYLAGDMKLAAYYYRKSVCLKGRCLLKIDYLLKYLKCCLSILYLNHSGEGRPMEDGRPLH